MLTTLADWFRQADTTDVHIAVGALLFLGLAALFGFLFFSKRLRLIADTPTARIRSASQGFVQLEGLTDWVPGPQIIAPLTRQPCVWYRYRIDEVKSRNGKRSRTMIEQGVSNELFLLKDDTGQCIIDPEGAVIIQPDRDTWRAANLSHDFGPGPGSSSWFASGRYHYTEERFHAHQQLLAIGEFTTRYHEGQSREERLRDRLRAWKNDPDIIKRFDSDQDGKLSVEDWEVVRAEAQRIVIEEMANEQQPDAFNLLQRGGTGTQRLLVLSSLSEQQLVFRYRFQAYTYAVVGIAALTIAIWGLVLSS